MMVMVIVGLGVLLRETPEHLIIGEHLEYDPNLAQLDCDIGED